MSWLQVVLMVYGLINIAGGFIGFVMAKSPASLAAGLGFGIVVLVLTFLSRTKPAMAFRALGVVTLALLGFWIFRYTEVVAQGKSPMMPMLNIALSVAVFACLAGAHFAAVRKRKLEGGAAH